VRAKFQKARRDPKTPLVDARKTKDDERYLEVIRTNYGIHANDAGWKRLWTLLVQARVLDDVEQVENREEHFVKDLVMYLKTDGHETYAFGLKGTLIEDLAKYIYTPLEGASKRKKKHVSEATGQPITKQVNVPARPPPPVAAPAPPVRKPVERAQEQIEQSAQATGAQILRAPPLAEPYFAEKEARKRLAQVKDYTHWNFACLLEKQGLKNKKEWTPELKVKIAKDIEDPLRTGAWTAPVANPPPPPTDEDGDEELIK
jgi:hypothetical protein